MELVAPAGNFEKLKGHCYAPTNLYNVNYLKYKYCCPINSPNQ